MAAAANDGLVDMEAPIPFITTHPDGSFQINPKAEEILQQIDGFMSVISIVGSGRTGKSYIMNRLFKSNRGFKLGPTTEAETKGIWMWAKPHPLDNNITLILLDSEGLNNPQKADDKHDHGLFSLILLLSCTMIYNVQKVLDESTIKDLHLVTELTKYIKISEDGQEESGDEFEKHFPKLIFLIRDMFLQPMINGEAVTHKAYMEDALKLKEGPREQESNKSRTCITKYFPERECYVLCTPVSDDEKLQKLDEIFDEDLKDKFKIQLEEFVKNVLKWVHTKFEDNNYMNGARYVQMASCYVNAINGNGIPCVKSAWEVVKEEQNKSATQGAINLFKKEMNKGLESNVPMDSETFSQLVENANEEARTYFIVKKWHDSVDDEICFKKLLAELQHHTEEFRRKNKEASQKKCEMLLAAATDELHTNITSGKYNCPGGSDEYKRDKEAAIEKYRDAVNKGPMADHVLEDYLKKTQKDETIIVQQDKKLTKEEKNKLLEDERRKQEEIKTREKMRMLQEELEKRKEKENFEEKAKEEQRVWKEKLAERKDAIIAGGVGSTIGTGAGVGVGVGVGALVARTAGASLGATTGGVVGGIIGAAIGGLTGGALGIGICKLVQWINKKEKEVKND